MKSPESLVKDQLFCVTGFKWQSKNPEFFLVSVPQLDMNGRPRTLESILWISRRKFNFPNC